MFGLGIGGTMSYGTEVGELWFAPDTDGADAGSIPNAINWRARQTVQALARPPAQSSSFFACGGSILSDRLLVVTAGPGA